MEALEVVINDINGTRDRFNTVLADKRIDFDREAGFAVQILQGNEYALTIAQKNRQSVVDAVTNIAAIGISLNPARKQAYLVPRDGRICLDISYMGLIDIAVDSGCILWAQANVVHAADVFRPTGVATAPIHEHDPFSKDRGEVRGVYVVVKTATGDFLTTAMSADEVNDIRDRSSAWKAWVAKKRSCPWVTDWNEMAKKTVVKRAYKYWPRGLQGERLAAAIEHLNVDGEEGLQSIRDQQPALLTPPPPPEPPADDTYPQADFDKNLPEWTKVIQSGRKTPAGLIATLSSRIKLSEAQKDKLKTIK